MRSVVHLWNAASFSYRGETAFLLLLAAPLLWFILSPPSGAVSYVALAYVLLAPGMIMLGFPTRLYLPVVASVLLVVPFSISLSAIVGSYLNFTPFRFDQPAPLIAVLLLSFALRWLASSLHPPSLSRAWNWKRTDWFLILAVLALAGLAVAITIDDILRVYLPSLDPWTVEVGVRETLARDLTPLSRFNSFGAYHHNYHGFNYLMTFLHTTTDLDVYPLQRFAGTLALAGTVIFASLAMRTMTNSSLGLIAGPLIVANPFLVRRFIIPFKEDVAVGMLMVLLFLLALALRSTDRRPFVVPLAVAFSALIQFHPLTLIIAVLFISVLVLSIVFTAGPDQERFGFPRIMLGAVALGTALSAPSAYRIGLNIYDEVARRAPVSAEVLVAGILLAGLAALALFLLATRFRGIRPGLVTAIVPAALVGALVLGVVNVGMNPLGAGDVVGPYNPTIKRVMFGSAMLLLLPGGLALLALRQYRDRQLRILLAFGISALFIANLPNLGIEFQVFRAVIYLSIAGAMLGAAYLVTLARSGTGRVFVPVLVVAIVAASTATGSLEARTFEMWNKDTIATVQYFKNIRTNKPGPLLAQAPDEQLLDYAGVFNVFSRARTGEVFRSPTFEELQQAILEESPGAVRAYLFFSRKKPLDTLRRFDGKVRERLLQRPEVEKLTRGRITVYIVSLRTTPAPAPTEIPVEPTPTPAEPICLRRLSSNDAAYIIQFEAGLTTLLLNPCEENNDVNEDGSIDAIDAALLLQFDAGLLEILPSEGGP